MEGGPGAIAGGEVIAELGHLALWLALATALLQVALPAIGVARGDEALIGHAARIAMVQAGLVLLAFAALVWAFVVSDFSVALVVANSHTDKPLLYKVSGAWANHEGSMLLWVLMLALAGAALPLFGRAMPAAFRARVLGVQALIALGFYGFLLLASNPFLRALPAPPQGNGLNPLLQDPGLAFHPPMLYAGYVGLSVSFSFAVAALLDRRVGPEWARWLRPWTLAAWSALSAGLALGSWWSYYELGWGGFWFWDPVENAALMPWLAATALLHSSRVLEKRDALRSWTLLLAVVAFSLSMIGTFIVRSGLLTSVHAFAVDPARGLFILGLLSVYIGGALALYAWRAPGVEAGAAFTFASREGGMIGNNLLLSAALGTVFIGTLYPLAVEALSNERISVGPPYFNATFAPLMLPLMLLMALGPFLPWESASDGAMRLRQRLAVPLLIGLGALAYGLARYDRAGVLGAIGLGVAALLAAATLVEFAARLRFGRGGVGASLARLVRLPASAWSMTIAHLGMALVAFGVTAVGSFETEALARLRIGQSMTLSGYTLSLRSVEPAAGPNYTAVAATMEVTREGRHIATLKPENRSFSDPPQETTEAGIVPLLGGDLYAVIGAPDGRDGWQVRFHWKPWVSALWLGALLVALGGVIGIVDSLLAASRRRASRSRAPLPVAPGLQPAE